MKNIKHILLVAFVAIAAMACRKDAEPGGTAVQEMCGEWEVFVAEKNNTAPVRMQTSNVSDDDPSKLRLVCTNATYRFNFVASCNYSARTFSATNAPSEHWISTAYPGTTKTMNVTVTEGKITEDAVTLPSGSKADKIEFKIKYNNIINAGVAEADDPTVYSFVGYRRSGFLEDEGYLYTGN